MTDLASISDEWWHGAGKPVEMAQPDYYKEHRNIVNLLETTGKSLLNEAKDQKNEATAMAKKLKAPNPFYHLRGGDYSWGGDEEVYYDPEGNRISKEDFEKQFQNQDKFPVEPEYPEQPQFVGDPSQFKPMPFDPNNPMMYRGSGAEDDELARKMAEFLAPHISQGIGQVADGIQDFFKSPEQREQEKRDKEALEEAERKKKEREEGSWSSYLSPFFHLSGGAIDKYIAMAKQFAKKAGYKDWDTLRRADDGEHKLELRGVKFGRKGYGDFIKYSLDEGEDKARKHRDAYLARATKIKGDWAKDMYSPNSLAIKILWGGGYSGGGKTVAELEAMPVAKLIEYGKSQGVKGLDGKTKAFIVDKIFKQAPETEVVAPKAGDVTPLQLYKMLLMDGSLEKDLIPLAKKQGIERILHKNKKTLVNEIYDNLLANEEIQATDSIEKVPKVVLYLFGKGEDPYALSDYDEDEEGQIELEEEEEEEDPDEVFVTQYIYDTNPYLVENPRAGLEFKDRRVFDPVADNEEMGTLGDLPNIARLVDENEGIVIVEQDEPEEKEKLPQQELDRERMLNTLKYHQKILDEPIIDPFTGRPRGADYQAFEKKKARESIKAITEQLKRLDSFKEIEGEPPALRSLRVMYGEDNENYKAWVKKFKKGEGVKKWEYPVKGSGKKPVLPPQDVLEGKKDNPIVEEIIEEPMDDTDIRQYLPNAKVMRYSGLARLSDIEQLLPTDKSYVILLYENTPGSGHWVALMRYGRTIEFFCSYGSKIDAPLRWQNPKDNAMLGQTAPFLSQLLNKAKGKFRVIHNPVAYQSSKQGVATCGAWDVMRINQMKNHNQDLQDFHDFMESVKKETGLSYDEIVVNYVSKR